MAHIKKLTSVKLTVSGKGRITTEVLNIPDTGLQAEIYLCDERFALIIRQIELLDPSISAYRVSSATKLT
jgi:hypothetical protein